MSSSLSVPNSAKFPKKIEQERRHWEDDLKLIVEGIASQVGEKFFQACSRYLAELLGIKYAFIAEFIDGECPAANILAFWAGDDFGTNFRYPLSGTPCDIVVDEGLRIYERGIQQMFPEDKDLVDLGAESYLGIAIQDSHGKVIGHLAGLDTEPLNQRCEELEAILKIFAARSAGEIERQTNEKALREQNQCLKETLRELQHAQAQLVQAEKLSSLGHMAAGLAHEINNPMTFINGNLRHIEHYSRDLLKVVHLYQQEYPQPNEVLQGAIAALELDFVQRDMPNMIASMQNGVQRVSDIVDSFQSFSRLNESHFKVVDVHDGLDAVLMILQSRIDSGVGESGVEVIKSYGRNIPNIHCSPRQLNQVFLDILKNALDALEEADRNRGISNGVSKSSKLWIRTAMESEGDSKNSVLISIADNGTGIFDDVKDKIFDPFFTTKPVGKGTGLGLSVSHQIVTEVHKGKLSCNSTPGKGTEFRVVLPVRI
ncbi:MAG: ATP-binding protein [Cyanobacteria bacterium P01_D01_bin.73]